MQNTRAAVEIPDSPLIYGNEAGQGDVTIAIFTKGHYVCPVHHILDSSLVQKSTSFRKRKQKINFCVFNYQLHCALVICALTPAKKKRINNRIRQILHAPTYPSPSSLKFAWSYQPKSLIVLVHPNCSLLIKCSTHKLPAPWLILYHIGAKHTGCNNVDMETQ